MYVCKDCGTEFDGKFCPECGLRFEPWHTCENCGHKYIGKYCPECGIKFGELKICPNCGSPITSRFCPDCGREFFVVFESVDEHDSDVTLPPDMDDLSFEDNGLRFESTVDKQLIVMGFPLHTYSEVTIPGVLHGKTVSIVEFNAFHNCCTLKGILLPDTVKFVRDYSFCGCTNLSRIIIGHNMFSIGHYAFYGCINLRYVFFNGSEDDWNKIQIDYGNLHLQNSKRYYYSENKPFRYGNFWHYGANGNPIVW